MYDDHDMEERDVSDSEQPEGDAEPSAAEDGEKSSNGGTHKLSNALPTDRVSMENQFKVLKAWGVATKDGTTAINSDVEQFAGVTASTISNCNPFFHDVGLLQRGDGHGYIAAPEVQDYIRALDFGSEDAPSRLAPVFQRSWAYEALNGRLQMGDVTKRTAIEQLASAADATKEHEQRLELILEWLERVGLITIDGQTIRRVIPKLAGHNDRTVDKPPPEPQRPLPTDGQPTLVVGLWEQLPKQGETWSEDDLTDWIALAQMVLSKVYVGRPNRREPSQNST